MNRKIKSLDKLTKIISRVKKQGKKIVTYNGGFDVLHIGHVLSIQEAKAQGDILIIPLNSDSSIRLYKGPNRPILPQNERASMLAALEAVDYVTIFNEINPKKVLDAIKPDIHCNGSDWGKNCIERETVERNGGRIHILTWQKGYSTTDVIKQILEVYKKPPVRAIFLDRDGIINENKGGYIHKIKDFNFTPYVMEVLRKLTKTDYKIIIATNQSGIGRGYFPQKQFDELTTWMVDTFRKAGIRIDRVYYCPHIPEDRCDCRKPNIGMLISAVKDFSISLNDSWFIGDDERDVVMGREANIKTIKLGVKMPPKVKLEPNFYAKDLREAVNIIFK